MLSYNLRMRWVCQRKVTRWKQSQNQLSLPEQYHKDVTLGYIDNRNCSKANSTDAYRACRMVDKSDVTTWQIDDVDWLR